MEIQIKLAMILHLTCTWMSVIIETENRYSHRTVVAHAFNPSTWEAEAEAEAGGSLGVQGQSGLQSEFQDSQGGYTEKSGLKHNKQANKGKVFTRMRETGTL